MQFSVGLKVISGARFWVHILFTLNWIYTTGSKEYCNADTFTPSCENDEVVFIEKAEFGRMRINRCVERDASGCSASALGVLDSRCSGRRKCEVRVADPSLEVIGTCDKEYKSYLDVDYRCLPVYSTTKHQCQISSHVILSQPRGFLPYILTEETDCGGDEGSWILEAKAGQTLNFTLYDFTWDMSTDKHVCSDILAVISEPIAKTRAEVCGKNGRRISHVMTTVSHRAEVRVYKRLKRADTSYFLLHYQVLGCPDPDLPEGMTLHRAGSTAQVVCTYRTDRKWTLSCVNGEWEGDLDNCSNTPGVIGNSRGRGNQWMPFPLDVSLALVAGVAFVVGCCIFVVGIFILKRNNFNEERKRQNAILLREAHDMTFGKYPAHPDPSDPEFKVHPASSGENRSLQGQPIENEYAYVTDFPPPPSPKTLRMCVDAKDQPQGNQQAHRMFKSHNQGKPGKDCYQMRIVDPRPALVPEPYFELDHCSSERRNSS